ncbi:hypothetical protein [Sessilibacter corallicola]|uniref:Uncharacterized protein n=1 Tax=Sessilibacter corallicola TaxID=2904075 RepID=A0ABQ0AF42_9GAMM
MSVKVPTTKLFSYVLLFLVFSPISALHAQSITDGVTVEQWKSFKATVGVGLTADCPVVNDALYRKITAAQYGGTDILSDQEFIDLVGNQHSFFGIFGGTKFYNRKTGKLADILETYAALQDIDISDVTNYTDPKKKAILTKTMQSFTPDSIPDNIPILCGDGSIEKRRNEIERQRYAKQQAEKLEYERTCEACTLKGGPLLQAIYDGDYDRQYDLALTYMLGIKRAGGRDAVGFGAIITFLSKVGDITLLEDLIGSYMLYTSGKWQDDCYDSGYQHISFTREFSDVVIETYSGIELERFEGGSVTTEYKINPDFQTACNALCNKHGAIFTTATAASGFGEQISAARVFWGLAEFVDKYQCRSPEIERFEANLLHMWETEKSAPRNVRRNSASEFFR